VLIASIASGNHSVFNYLLYELKCDPNLCDSIGNSPLYIAVYKGDHALVKHLLKNGADPKLRGP
jgi:ankyrin repeat protein